jgi:hypothetical protein
LAIDGYRGFGVTGGGFGEKIAGMRWRHFRLGIAVLFVAMGSRMNAAPNQMVPKGLGKKVVVPELLSFLPPAGWIQEETSGDLQMRGPVSNGVVPDITVNPGNNGSLSDLKDTYQPELYDTGASLKIVANTLFTTAAGVKGVRLQEVDATGKVTQYSYIFLNSDGQQLELACACATMDAKVYLPVFEASMKTVVIAKGD